MRSEINKRAGQRRKAQMNMAAKSPIASPTNDQKRHAQLVKEARGKFKSESSSEESKKVHLWLPTDALTINGPAVNWVSFCLRILNFSAWFWTKHQFYSTSFTNWRKSQRSVHFNLCIQRGQRQIIRHLWMKEGWDMWHSIDVKLSLCPFTALYLKLNCLIFEFL